MIRLKKYQRKGLGRRRIGVRANQSSEDRILWKDVVVPLIAAVMRPQLGEYVHQKYTPGVSNNPSKGILEGNQDYWAYLVMELGKLVL